MPSKGKGKSASSKKSKWPLYLLIGIVSVTVVVFASILIYRAVLANQADKSSNISSQQPSAAAEKPQGSQKKKVTFIHMKGCGYCEKLDQVYKHLKDTDTVTYEKKDYRDVPDLMDKLDINGFPAVVFHDEHGNIQNHVVGYSQSLIEQIQSHGN